MKTNRNLPNRVDWLKRALLRIFLVLVVLALTGMIYQTAATEADERNYPPPGILVSVDGHKMHIYCLGQGSPTIVLDHAGGGSSVDWSLIQPELAEHTRVCAYDRAGFGWSDYSPAPRTIEQQVQELRSLLVGANVPGPYILVGHSYGGRVDRVYAAKYVEQVAGMVLIDPGMLSDDPRYPPEAQAQIESENRMIRTAGGLAPFGLVRLLRPLLSSPTYDLPEDAQLVSDSFAVTARFWRSINDQIDLLPAVFNEERQITSLGDLPLLVISSTEPDDATHRVWRQANRELADLSTIGSYREVEGATHYSLVYRQRDAQMCIAGILEVLDAVQKTQDLSRTTE